MRFTFATRAVTAALCCGPSEGLAAIISGSYTFTASNFGTVVPADPVTGTVTFSFDNSASIPAAPTSDGTSSLGSAGWYELYIGGSSDALEFLYGGASG